MHAVFFGLKRAYQGTLRITRRPLRKIGLTAARFDLLYAVKDCGGAVLQSALRKILGVCRATVSKMLISLEKLGLVKRSVYPGDRRQRLVTLTWPGRKKLGGAKRDFVRSGWAELAFASAIGCSGLYQWYSAESCLEAKSWLLARLDALREGFSDFASLEYPWDPEGAALERLEDEAFEDPWQGIAEQEQREGAGRPPGVEPWNGEGPCPWDNDGPFPWDDEGVRTWKELARRERMRRAEERRAEKAAARLAKKAARRSRRRAR
jgi:DNA-binding MarR family transcriptional regulator